MEKINPQEFMNQHGVEEIKKELFSQIEKDRFIYQKMLDLGLSRKDIFANVAKISEYQEDYHYCENCPGLANCKKKNPHLELTLIYEDNELGREFTPCKRIRENIDKNKNYLYRDFDEDILNTKIDFYEERKKVLNAFSKVIASNNNTWFYLSGPINSGKSFLAAHLANIYVTKTNREVAYLEANNRIKELSDLYFEDREKFDREFNSLANISLLIIDNFGSEYHSDFIRDTILYPLLYNRYKNNKVTILVSDFALNDLNLLYASKNRDGYLKSRQFVDLIKGKAQEYNLETILFK